MASEEDRSINLIYYSVNTSVNSIAKLLRWNMERLDPSDNSDLKWEEIPDIEKMFYRDCVKAIFNGSSKSDLMIVMEYYKGKPETT